MADIHHIIIQTPKPEIEILEAYSVSQSFYREVQLRQDHEQDCQRYKTVAAQHQKELESMQKDINFLGWFYRGRG
ncbi:hypothetical protein IQ268_02165 [Oculatella sp. LEGE 06141]|uniref:hypothetical protein n=1 Tax=Oculatella sp. LEGE 06141 TaxID=1828648 RepID=UPI0018824FF2|nr:hypothetical protein [Oculatella sp. LEGE 06141]MBE9177379.1 hypothetical protein [Oculatella sp. LEGE 06141]